MQLGYTPQGQLELTVRGEAETYSLLSSTALEPDNLTTQEDEDSQRTDDGTLSPGRWHTIAVRHTDNLVTLSVDGVIDTLEVRGNLSYSGSGDYELLAPVQTVQYNSLRIYDWNSEPLLALSDPHNGNQITGPVELDGQGRVTLDIQSLGHLNDQQPDSLLQTLRVAIISGGSRDYVSLVASDTYQELSGYYIEHLADGAPALEDGSQGSLPIQMMIGALDIMVPPAHAFFGDALWSAFNFIIPIEDVGVLIQQLYYLATDSSKFDRAELVASAVGTLTIIPIAKPLKPFVPGLKALMKVGSRIRPAFFQSSAGPLGRAVKRAFKGNTDDILVWLPMLYLMAEMVLEEDSREALFFITDTISSEGDLMAWVEYLALPTTGWEREGTGIASISNTTDDVALLDTDVRSGNALLGYIFNDAHATRNPGPRLLVNVRKIVRLVEDMKLDAVHLYLSETQLN